MYQGDLFTLRCAEKMSVLSFLEFHKHPRPTDGGETYTVSLCYLSLLWFELSPFRLGTVCPRSNSPAKLGEVVPLG